MRRRVFAVNQVLPVAVVIPLPMAMMVVVTMPVVVTDADPDRAHLDTNHRSIGGTGHKAKRNNRSK
jgi:hypothetical protein